MKFNIYLDVDGVLLANDKYPAKHVETFLEYVTTNYPTYWLTTHCHAGDTAWVMEFLRTKCAPRIMHYAMKVKPTLTDWDKSKTEAIDFSQPFLWFDDDLYPEEREELVLRNCLSNWVEVDLSEDEEQLLNLIKNFPIPLKPAIK